MEIKALCIKIPKNVGLKLRFNSRTKVMKTTKVKLLKLAFKNPFCNNFLELTRQCDSNSVLGVLTLCFISMEMKTNLQKHLSFSSRS